MVNDAVQTRHSGRLIAWLVFVSLLALLAYSARLTDTETPDDLAYRYSSSVAAVIQYGIMLGILLLIARGLPRRELFALRRPASWKRALGLAVLALLAIYAAAFVYERALSLFGNWNATDEQGLVPDGWDASRAAPFVANFLVIAIVAPFVEELTYRGLGFAAVASAYGPVTAIVVTSLAFGLAHGLVVALPVLTIFGAILAWLRFKTKSIYPTVILHGLFNGAALIAAVST